MSDVPLNDKDISFNVILGSIYFIVFLITTILLAIAILKRWIL